MVKTVFKSFYFRLYPSKEQEILLSKHFGCSRFIYNHFLSERINQYKNTKKSDSYNKQANKLAILKKQDDTAWLKEVNSQALQASLKNLDVAYKSFFKGKSKFPRFKSKNNKNSFTVPQHGKVKDGRIYIPKFKEGIKTKCHRDINGRITRMTVTKKPSGKYYVSILAEVYIETLSKTGKSVGCDMGIKDFLITSDDQKFKNSTKTFISES